MSNPAKEAAGALTHGVYVLGVKSGETVNLMTAAWITQISSSPAILVAVGTSHYTAQLIREAGHFSVSTLRAGQRDIALHCGSVSGRNTNKLNGLSVTYSKAGDPLIADAAAHMECEVVNIYEDGDHTLFSAKIVDGKTFHDDYMLYRHKEFFA